MGDDRGLGAAAPGHRRTGQAAGQRQQGRRRQDMGRAAGQVPQVADGSVVVVIVILLLFLLLLVVVLLILVLFVLLVVNVVVVVLLLLLLVLVVLVVLVVLDVLDVLVLVRVLLVVNFFSENLTRTLSY